MSKYIQSDKFVLRKVATNIMLLPTDSESQNEHSGAIVINEIAEFIWSQLKEALSMDEIVGKLLDTYDIDKETAEKDVEALLNMFTEYDIVNAIE